MGTGFERECAEVQEGIIPRAVRHLFSAINNLKDNPYDENGVCLDLLQFSVGAQFMELYNEEIIDLLDPYNKVSKNSAVIPRMLLTIHCVAILHITEIKRVCACATKGSQTCQKTQEIQQQQ